MLRITIWVSLKLFIDGGSVNLRQRFVKKNSEIFGIGMDVTAIVKTASGWLG